MAGVSFLLRFFFSVTRFSPSGGEPALIHEELVQAVHEEIVRVVLHVIAYRILPKGMALTGRPSVGAPVGVRAAGGGPPALGR